MAHANRLEPWSPPTWLVVGSSIVVLLAMLGSIAAILTDGFTRWPL